MPVQQGSMLCSAERARRGAPPPVLDVALIAWPFCLTSRLHLPMVAASAAVHRSQPALSRPEQGEREQQPAWCEQRAAHCRSLENEILPYFPACRLHVLLPGVTAARFCRHTHSTRFSRSRAAPAAAAAAATGSAVAFRQDTTRLLCTNADRGHFG